MSPIFARSIYRDTIRVNLLEGGLGLMQADDPGLEPGGVSVEDMPDDFLSLPVFFPDPLFRQTAGVVGRSLSFAAVLRFLDEPPGTDNSAPTTTAH